LASLLVSSGSACTPPVAFVVTQGAAVQLAGDVTAPVYLKDPATGKNVIVRMTLKAGGFYRQMLTTKPTE
jgi:hypothetical protein